MRFIYCLVTSAVLSLGLSSSLSAWAEIGVYERYRDAGEKAFGQNNYGQAEKNFLLALKEAEKFGPKDLRMACALKNLASLYEVRGQFSKAESYWERELRCKEKALGGEHPQVLFGVGKILRFYLAHNQQAKAERLSKLLLAYAEKTGKQNQTMDAHVTELSKYFSAHGEYAPAAAKMNQMNEIMHKVRADDHLELAASFDAIAALYQEKGKLNLAEQFYRRSLELREKALPPGHLALAFGYEHMAKLYMAQGRVPLAQALFKQSLEVTGQTLDLKRPEVYSRLESLARSYQATGQKDQAEMLYKQALTLLKQNVGERHRDVGLASFALADLYLKEGRYAEAEPLLKTALSISESMNGPKSANLIPVLDAYAETLAKLNQGAQAAKARNRANAIRGVATASAGGDSVSDL